jgi:hypothetical protein
VAARRFRPRRKASESVSAGRTSSSLTRVDLE